MKVFSVDEFGEFGSLPSIISAVLAIASIGLFFGLLGYVFEHISLQVSVIQPRLFRDYWSNIHFLGKSDKREFSSLDRKLSSWSIRKIEWWKGLLAKITEPQPDLIFSQHKKKADSEFSTGDLFDLASGRMIGQNLISPSDLTSKFKPMVLKIAETTVSPKGLRRLAFEKLVARLLERFIFSRLIWILYLLLSISLVSSVYLIELERNLVGIAIPYSEVISAAVASVASAVTLLFVWQWQKSSKELFERRPDERILIFLVYLVLALLYLFYFEAILNPPLFYVFGEQETAFPKEWIGSWAIWTEWFLFSSILIGLGYIFIHRECEVVNTYFYDNLSPESGASQVSPFKDPYDEPFWLKKEKVKAYWVLRFMYFWHYEITTNLHPDWERVEVWVDAEKGTPKWVVTDYHYRELWYNVKETLPLLYVKFFINFHTPVPIVDLAETEFISDVFSQKSRALFRAAITGKALKTVENLRPKETSMKFWTTLHSADWVLLYGLPNLASKFCSQLPWTYWRYPRGLEKAETYLQKPAVTLEDQPIPTRKKS
jgi:hypothetical protein